MGNRQNTAKSTVAHTISLPSCIGYVASFMPHHGMEAEVAGAQIPRRGLAGRCAVDSAAQAVLLHLTAAVHA